MPGLLEIDKSVKDQLKECYLKSIDKRLILQFRFQDNMNEVHKILFAKCIADSFIQNKEGAEKLGLKVTDMEIQF